MGSASQHQEWKPIITARGRGEGSHSGIQKWESWIDAAFDEELWMQGQACPSPKCVLKARQKDGICKHRGGAVHCGSCWRATINSAPGISLSLLLLTCHVYPVSSPIHSVVRGCYLLKQLLDWIHGKPTKTRPLGSGIHQGFTASPFQVLFPCKTGF